MRIFRRSVCSSAIVAILYLQPALANETDKRLDRLEKRLAELEQQVAQKDRKIEQLERETMVSARIADKASEVAISSALSARILERPSYQFDAPDKSIQLTNSDTTLQISGQIWLDAIYNSGEMTNRAGFQPSSIAYDKGTTQDKTTLSAGQSNLSINSSTPTQYGAMTTRLGVDLFDSQGNAKFNLTHLWGELGNWGAGQTFSGFMDIDAFPNIMDYWGPNSVVFARQPQLRYNLYTNADDKFMFTIEKSDADLALPNFVTGNDFLYIEQNDLPDITASYINGFAKGYIKSSIILRQLGYETSSSDDMVVGWGINVSGKYAIDRKNTLKYQLTHGEGIGRYVNDACCSYYADGTADGVATGGSDAGIDINGKLQAIPITVGYAYLDHQWSDKYTSSIGFGYVDIDNITSQRSRALSNSLYSNVNVVWNPTVMSRVGVELQYGKVTSFGNEDADNVRLQTSIGFKY